MDDQEGGVSCSRNPRYKNLVYQHELKYLSRFRSFIETNTSNLSIFFLTKFDINLNTMHTHIQQGSKEEGGRAVVMATRVKTQRQGHQW